MRWIALLTLSAVLLLTVAACTDDENGVAGPTATDVIATNTSEPDATATSEPTDQPATDTAEPPTATTTPVNGGGTDGDGDTNGNCHPSYQGACLAQGVGDWDCTRAGGGNGPNYVEDVASGPVQVVGRDEFGLDGNDDGTGCE